ncbi:hypothetical protein ASG29_11170 [Sphingomonas sp. Leaf412]|uniref:ribbon-helix-helix domain-containing protein n=1 Tax=Sphingomonas sp. Leaf412 TaxID=1736370 RepID=UPI00072C22E1|nr:type II toxin-antitoxin system ParD family antitoxin [Sphingomonas sp. Leaf412]KQT32356.1 hypothetical protein ASG29_11170 [Sphingomonas sp. Leaf412]
MSDLTISIPPALQQWVEVRLSDGEYADVADYVRDLMRRDRAAGEEVARIRALVAEGLASGVDERDAGDVLAEVMARIPRG